jgi:hypothetical protein
MSIVSFKVPYHPLNAGIKRSQLQVLNKTLPYKRDDDIPPPKQHYDFPFFENVPFSVKFQDSRRAMSTVMSLNAAFKLHDGAMTCDELADIIESKWGKLHKLEVKPKLGGKYTLTLSSDFHEHHEEAHENYSNITDFINSLNMGLHVRTAIKSHTSFIGPARDKVEIRLA